MFQTYSRRRSFDITKCKISLHWVGLYPSTHYFRYPSSSSYPAQRQTNLSPYERWCKTVAKQTQIILIIFENKNSAWSPSDLVGISSNIYANVLFNGWGVYDVASESSLMWGPSKPGPCSSAWFRSSPHCWGKSTPLVSSTLSSAPKYNFMSFLHVEQNSF